MLIIDKWNMIWYVKVKVNFRFLTLFHHFLIVILYNSKLQDHGIHAVSDLISNNYTANDILTKASGINKIDVMELVCKFLSWSLYCINFML